MDWGPLKRRYVTTLKTLFLIFVGAFLAKGYSEFPTHSVIITSIFASILWAGLYTLNEAADQTIEEGKRIQKWIVAASWTLITISIIGSTIFTNLAIGILMLFLVINQLFYCSKPIRLKRNVWAGPFFTGVSNPAIRMLIGIALSVNQTTPWNLVNLGMVINTAIHLAFAIKTRVYRKERDIKLGYSYIPDWVTNKYLEPLQFITPLFLLCYIRLVNILIHNNLIIGYLALSTIPIVICIILIIWRVNNLYDDARHRKQQLSIELYHGLCLAKIRQIVNLWEILCIAPINSAFAMTLCPISYLLVPLSLIAYKRLSMPNITPVNS